MSVYKCYDCNQVLCEDCFRKHNDKNKYQSHSMQRVSDSFILNWKFRLENDMKGATISDIKCLPNGDVIVISCIKREIQTFSLSGIQRHVLHLEGWPSSMDVVDKNTVAVSLQNYNFALVDFQQNHVQYIRSKTISHISGSFMYIENEFYIVDGFVIVVIDMSGSIKRRIKLSFTPCDMCYDVDSQRIYCMDIEHSELLCIDRDGNDIFTFTNPSMNYSESLTIDNDGNVLVLCKKHYNSGNVIKVDSNGEKSEEVITNIINMFSYHDTHICYDHFTNSVVIGSYKEVNIYKKK